MQSCPMLMSVPASAPEVPPLAAFAPIAATQPGLRRPVSFFRPGSTSRLPSHDALTKMEVAASLAELLGVEFVGELDEDRVAAAGSLVVPSDTVEGLARAERLGIRHAAQLFGGVVPHRFVATKLISHPLVREGAAAPEGWSAAFGHAVRDVVLPGYSVFSTEDALSAGAELLRHGRLRIKEPDGVGGSGQYVVGELDELHERIAALDEAALRDGGLVLERNLREVATLSVGQVHVGPWLITYCGTQGLTRNHHGHQVYGGSALTVVRGGYRELLELRLTPSQRTAVQQALTYHAAATECFDGLLTTRANYDIAQGIDDAGRTRSGVLEQSWRIGGASGAELAAMHAFDRDPALGVVRAFTTEVYASEVEVPDDAWVTYQGVDPHVGALTKYARTEAYDDV